MLGIFLQLAILAIIVFALLKIIDLAIDDGKWKLISKIVVGAVGLILLLKILFSLLVTVPI